MCIKNINIESGVSTGILMDWAERKDVSLWEIICERGLPHDVTFQQMIKVLECPRIEQHFKTYVLSRAQKIAKTDDDQRALRSHDKQKKSSDKSSDKQSVLLFPSLPNKPKQSGTITPEALEEILFLQDSLVQKISEKERKEVLRKLDVMVCQLLNEAKDNGEQLLEIYNLLSIENKRIPYLKQELSRKGINYSLK